MRRNANHAQLKLIGQRIHTAGGIKHICLSCDARFWPIDEVDFMCAECREMGDMPGLVNRRKDGE